MKTAQGLNIRLRVVGAAVEAAAATTEAAKYAAKLLKSLAEQTKRNFDPPGEWTIIRAVREREEGRGLAGSL